MSVFADITQLQKPKALMPIVARAKDYIATMKALNKPVNHVAMEKVHYDKLMASVTANREPHEPEIVGLRIGEVRVERRGG